MIDPGPNPSRQAHFHWVAAQWLAERRWLLGLLILSSVLHFYAFRLLDGVTWPNSIPAAARRSGISVEIVRPPAPESPLPAPESSPLPAQPPANSKATGETALAAPAPRPSRKNRSSADSRMSEHPKARSRVDSAESPERGDIGVSREDKRRPAERSQEMPGGRSPIPAIRHDPKSAETGRAGVAPGKIDREKLQSTLKDVAREIVGREGKRDRLHEELGAKIPSEMYGGPKDALELRQDRKAMLKDEDGGKGKRFLKLPEHGAGWSMTLGKHCKLGGGAIRERDTNGEVPAPMPFTCDF